MISAKKKIAKKDTSNTDNSSKTAVAYVDWSVPDINVNSSIDDVADAETLEYSSTVSLKYNDSDEDWYVTNEEISSNN